MLGEDRCQIEEIKVKKGVRMHVCVLVEWSENVCWGWVDNGICGKMKKIRGLAMGICVCVCMRG